MRLQPLRQRGADLGRGLEHADPMSRGGEQIGDAVTHQAAADHGYFLFPLIMHVYLANLSEL